MNKQLIYPLTNPRFQSIFLKNTLAIFLSISVPLLISVFTVYSYSRNSLMKETDAANLRSLENTRATVDMIIDETGSMLLRYASNNEMVDLLSTRKELYPNYDYIRRAMEQIKIMAIGTRPYLDHAITAYSEVSDFMLSTLMGGQTYTYFNDKGILTTYNTLRQDNPDEFTYYKFRQADYMVISGLPEWVLTFYRKVSLTSSDQEAFVAIDVSVEMLRNYLTSNTNSSDGTILLLDQENQIIFDSTGVYLGKPVDSLLDNYGEIDGFFSGDGGVATIQVDGIPQRVSWLPLQQNNLEGTKCVQIVPYDNYYENMDQLGRILIVTVLIGMFSSVIIAYLTSRRLFRPIASILKIVENPMAFDPHSDRSGEIHYLLMQVVSAFQKNLTLENEMVEKMSSLRNARAKALQEQMTPHFLYNALQAINWLALSETKREDSRTSASIITLAEIVRTCMEQSDNFTTVAEEITHVKKYMEIEQLRFGDNIVCTYEIDEQALPMKILRISFQPLVENAISHGLKPRGCTGHIHVRVAVVGEMLHCSVEDNGVGMPDEQMEEILSACKMEYVYANQHVGLVNLSQRIKLVYGEQYELTLQKGRYGGLLVKFVIPQVK